MKTMKKINRIALITLIALAVGCIHGNIHFTSFNIKEKTYYQSDLTSVLNNESYILVETERDFLQIELELEDLFGDDITVNVTGAKVIKTDLVEPDHGIRNTKNYLLVFETQNRTIHITLSSTSPHNLHGVKMMESDTANVNETKNEWYLFNGCSGCLMVFAFVICCVIRPGMDE